MSISLKYPNHIRQQGMVSLLISLSIVSLIVAGSLVMLFISYSSQKNAALDLRSNQAFDAAQSGLFVATSFTNENRDTVIVDSDGDGFISYVVGPATLSNSASYTVTITNPAANNFDTFDVVSVGTSDDGTITRTIYNQIYYEDLNIVPAPPTPLVTRGSVSISGNVSVTNTLTDLTVWSGGSVSFSGSSDTQTSSGTGSDKNYTGADVTENDGQLSSISSNDFFESFFGQSRASVKAMATTVLSSTGSENYKNDLSGLNDQIIWIEQDGGTASVNSNITIGTPSKPVTLIVSGTGDFKLNGGVTIYGIVYVDFNWANSGGGNAEIYGSAIVNGDFSSTGTPDMVYVDSANILAGESADKKYTQIPGSWRDF